MNGAIFFSGRYGSTAQYANWISERTGLPVFDTKVANADPSKYDFLVVGSPIFYYKALNRNWVKKNLADIENKPTLRRLRPNEIRGMKDLAFYFGFETFCTREIASSLNHEWRVTPLS